MSADLRIEIFVDDLDAFVDFYERVLAFAISDDRRATDHPYVLVQRDQMRIGASAAWSKPAKPSRTPPTGVEIVLEVDDDDFAAEFARVTASGWAVSAPLERQPWGLTDFRLYDPDGYYIRVTDRTGVN